MKVVEWYSNFVDFIAEWLLTLDYAETTILMLLILGVLVNLSIMLSLINK